MIIGDPGVFAVESQMTSAYERPSLRGLGYFVIHINSIEYGVRSADATMLASSFDSVERRIAARGTHSALLLENEQNAGTIADAILGSVYAPDQDYKGVFGVPRTELSNLLHSNALIWAPDGDEAFDDGSHVVQFDARDRVRLIGFKSRDGYRHEPGSLSDIWISADAFYGILARWHQAFEDEWIAALKTPEPSR